VHDHLRPARDIGQACVVAQVRLDGRLSVGVFSR
jgi:hypothetical protein